MTCDSSTRDDEVERSQESQLVALFLAHQAGIYAFIVSLVPNRSDAEDLLQETGMVLHRRFGEFEPGTSFLAWACQIAYHKVLDFRKRQSRSPIYFDTDFVEVVARQQISEATSLTKQYAALLKCLEKLSNRDRALLEKCYHPHVTVKTVASELRRPVDTVYKRLRACGGRCLTASIEVWPSRNANEIDPRRGVLR